MIEFMLRCVHCGKCYALSNEARELFLKTDNALNKFNQNIQCCDDPCWGVDIAIWTVDANEMNKLLEVN